MAHIATKTNLFNTSTIGSTYAANGGNLCLYPNELNHQNNQVMQTVKAARKSSFKMILRSFVIILMITAGCAPASDAQTAKPNAGISLTAVEFSNYALGYQVTEGGTITGFLPGIVAGKPLYNSEAEAISAIPKVEAAIKASGKTFATVTRKDRKTLISNAKNITRN